MRVQPAPRLLQSGGLRRSVAAEAEHRQYAESGSRHQGVVLRDQQVLQHGHAGEQADVLERAGTLAMAAMRWPGMRCNGNVLPSWWVRTMAPLVGR